METSSKPFSGYDTGADFWRDNVLCYGIDEAVTIGNDYLNMNLKRELSEEERQFCRELFRAMYEATAGKTDTATLVYPYDFKEANERWEVSCYHESRQCNRECAKEIADIINDSCYATNYYNLEIAALITILNYGFARVNRVLAFNIQKHYNDGRYSSANKRWSQTFTVPEQSFNGAYLTSHACLVDGFTDYVRKLQQ